MGRAGIRSAGLAQARTGSIAGGRRRSSRAQDPAMEKALIERAIR
jgi:hypothetical protein